MTPNAPRSGDACTCGHAYEAHEHYRAGTDCSLCEKDACPRFVAAASSSAAASPARIDTLAVPPAE